MRYRVKFGSSATKGVRINRKKPSTLGVLGPRPLAVGPSVTPRNTTLPTCYLAEFGHSRSNDTSVINEIRLKN